MPRVPTAAWNDMAPILIHTRGAEGAWARWWFRFKLPKGAEGVAEQYGIRLYVSMLAGAKLWFRLKVLMPRAPKVSKNSVDPR